MLAREEQEPYRDAENQDQADVYEKTQKTRHFNTDEAAHSDCDDGKHNPGCQRDQPRWKVRSKHINRRNVSMGRATALERKDRNQDQYCSDRSWKKTSD